MTFTFVAEKSEDPQKRDLRYQEEIILYAVYHFRNREGCAKFLNISKRTLLNRMRGNENLRPLVHHYHTDFLNRKDLWKTKDPKDLLNIGRKKQFNEE